MTQLDKDWITKGLIDVEYKKYILLAYLQWINNEYHETRLYPSLSDLIQHYNYLKDLQVGSQQIMNAFPKNISRVDFEKFQFEYEKLIEDDETMKQINEIISYALPEIKNKLNEGKAIYEHVEGNVSLLPVGVNPIRKDDGYLLINYKDSKEVNIYEYNLTLFQSGNDNYRGVHIHLIDSVRKSIVNTFESMKIELIKKQQKYAHPAVYLIQTNLLFPLYETLLPVAQRLLVKEIVINDRIT